MRRAIYRSPRFFCQARTDPTEKNLHRPPRKCYRQVIDLVRLCLVFGLPLLVEKVRARMKLMKQFGRRRGQAICPVLALLLVAACSRPGLRSDDSAAPAAQHQVPFQDPAGNPSTNSHATAGAPDHLVNGEAGLPFRDDQSLPAGTLLTVRLKSPIAADDPDARGTFEAVVDEPLVIDGNTLIPRGATAAGRVEA